MKLVFLRFLLLFFFFGTTLLSLAQVPLNPILFSSQGYDYVTDATTDAQGNIYVLGSFDGKQGTVITPTSQEVKGSYTWYVAIFNKEGVLQNMASVGQGSGSGSYLHSIAVDKLGNVYITGSASHSITVSKYNPNLSFAWHYTEGVNSYFIGRKVLADEKGNVYVTGTVSAWSINGLDLTPENSCCDDKSFLLKLDSEGKHVWVRAGLGTYVRSAGNSMAFDKEGNLVLVGTIAGSGDYGGTTVRSAGNDNLLIVRYSPDGNVLMAKAVGARNQNIQGNDVAIDEFNNLYISGTYAFSATFGATTLPPTSDVGGVYREAFVAKFDSFGTPLWAKHGTVGSSGTTAKSIAYKDGKVQIAGMQGYFSRSTPYVMSYLPNGTFLWKSYLGQVNGDANKVLILSSSTSQVFGTFFDNFKATDQTFASYGIMDGYTVQLYDTSSAPYSSFIKGTVFHDENQNCKLNENERGLAGIIVTAMPGPYYGITDEKGRYSINVEKGKYQVAPVLPSHHFSRVIVPSCMPTTKEVEIKTAGSVVNNLDFGNQATLSPNLKVDLSSNRRRRCMENLTTVSYANTGFASAPNAKVHVQFPPEVVLKSASLPFILDEKGNHVFEVGTLQPGQRGTISITDSVSCADPSIRGLTVCTRAWLTPGNAYPESPAWDRADIFLAASEEGGNQARFVLRNRGRGGMADSLSFRLFEDQRLVLVARFRLAAGDSTVLRVPTQGRVLRLEADQPPGHPVKAMASANLEIRARNTGFPDVAMMVMPPNDPEPEVSESCQPIIDSFDPNDKQVVPVGLTAAFYTPTNTPLRYTVRFQNTGTDVAYRVVVVDTLSADLDMGTFQVGAVSHPYVLTVSGKERPVLTFTFNDIMLPDSSADEPGSNGFVQFSVRPKSGLPEKHLVENLADIFFDYNEPVRTNTVQNRIYDMPPVQSDRQLQIKDVLVSPSISFFTPTQSCAGQLVTISGKNFSSNASSNKVFFHGVAAQVQTASSTELKAVVPAGAFSGRIKIITPDGAAYSSTDYVIFQPPTFASISVNEAKPGTVIVISGSHFSPIASEDSVYFNGTWAKVLEATTTQLMVEVPATATKGKILLKTLGGQVESAQEIMVWHQPSLTDFHPGKGKAGATITLNGGNFAEIPNRNTVLFGTMEAQVTAAGANRLTVRVPENAPTGKIHVQTPGGTASTSTGFIFIPAPVISSFTPASGNAGTIVTISGKNFGADGQTDTIYFNGQPAQLISAKATELVVRAPKYFTSGAIMVAGAGGTTAGEAFNVHQLTKEEAISIFPNPTRGEITVNWHKAHYHVEHVRVYDAVGKLLKVGQVVSAPGDEIQLNLSLLGPGVYTLQVQTSEGLVLKRVVIL